jgi:hypothetical protein
MRLAMLVFIDESGDAGFKMAAGSSPVFALAMVIFDDHRDAIRTQKVILRALERLGIRPEFKFNKCRAELRDSFFAAVADCRFRMRAVVVRKEIVGSARLRNSPESFYHFFLKTMMRFDERALVDARVIVDGSGDRKFKRKLGAHIRQHLQRGAVTEVKFKDSRNEPLLQLADMCVGAIARAYRSDSKSTTRWSAYLSDRIDDLWEFA